MPPYLRTADHDVTWANYQAHGPDSNADASLAATSGGVRRMKTREYRRLREAEEEERAEAVALEMVAKLASQKKVQTRYADRRRNIPLHLVCHIASSPSVVYEAVSRRGPRTG